MQKIMTNITADSLREAAEKALAANDMHGDFSCFAMTMEGVGGEFVGRLTDCTRVTSRCEAERDYSVSIEPMTADLESATAYARSTIDRVPEAGRGCEPAAPLIAEIENAIAEGAAGNNGPENDILKRILSPADYLGMLMGVA